MKESDLYLPLKNFFEKQDYEVYAEVKVNYTRGRVDLVAFDKRKPVAVEMKTSLSKGLIEQAKERQKIFPFVYIAIPMRKRDIDPMVLLDLASEGIGVLEVYRVGAESKVKVNLQAIESVPKVKLRKNWNEILLPEHQTWVPGGHAGGGYVTEYALTMKRIHDYLKAGKVADHDFDRSFPDIHGWRSVSEIAANVKTHFANPKSQIGPALLDHETEWAEAQKVTGRWFFRHIEGSQKYEK